MSQSQPLPLWQHLPVILQRVVAHAWCALRLDYDGTLAPIVADPAAARLSPAMRQVLMALVHHPRYRVAIVGGRALAELRARVAGTTPYLAGNHGLEMVTPGSSSPCGAFCNCWSLRDEAHGRGTAGLMRRRAVEKVAGRLS